jgi:predicted cupin superfamily sugar epimerase
MFFKLLPARPAMKPEYLIRKLSLAEHPEGGYFRQTHKSDKQFDLPGYDSPRSACTTIYYLLKSSQFSAFHRIRSDEIWHFYAGSALALHVIERGGHLRKIVLGNDPGKSQVFQAVVRAGDWFAASVVKTGLYSLVGCTVAPGFEYQDWELADRETLLKVYPRHRKIICKYTR